MQAVEPSKGDKQARASVVERTTGRYMRQLQGQPAQVRRGCAAALGVLPRPLLAPVQAALLSTLAAATQVPLARLHAPCEKAMACGFIPRKHCLVCVSRQKVSLCMRGTPRAAMPPYSHPVLVSIVSTPCMQLLGKVHVCGMVEKGSSRPGGSSGPAAASATWSF